MNLVKHPDPILTQVAEIVSEDDHGQVVAMGDKAKKLMVRHKGVGLAANQVGDLRRWFVWKFGDICINPTFNPVPGSEIVKTEEGCLSYGEPPYPQFNVRRHTEIDAWWTNRKGKVVTKRLKGLPAQVFQHETDHLNGINIWDSKRERAQKELMLPSMREET